MKKITILFMSFCLIFMLTACKQSDRTSSDSSMPNYKKITSYENFLNDLKNKQDDLYYYIKDIDANNIDDLLVLENTKLSVYTYKKSVELIGEQDFLTGTVRFFSSDNINYPGIFYYTVGGGVDHYGYMTIKNNKLQFEELWSEDYSGINGEKGKIIEISKNENLIKESKKLYKNNKDVEFIILKGNNNTYTNTEICSYIVNPNLPDYEIKITYNSPENENAISLSLLKEKSSMKIQHILLDDNNRFTKQSVYIEDITFDGYSDVLVPYQSSASAQYFMAFVWDTTTNKLVYTPTFENLPNVALDKNKKAILSSRSADKTTSYSISVFDKDLNDFKICKSFYYYLDDENIIYKEKKLDNSGKMQIISDFTIPYNENDDYYSMNPEIESYYNKSDWNFDSPKWKEYLIPPSVTSAN